LLRSDGVTCSSHVSGTTFFKFVHKGTRRVAGESALAFGSLWRRFGRFRQWHADEVFMKIDGTRHYVWRAVDREGEVLEGYVAKKRDKSAVLRFMK